VLCTERRTSPSEDAKLKSGGRKKGREKSGGAETKEGVKTQYDLKTNHTISTFIDAGSSKSRPADKQEGKGHCRKKEEEQYSTRRKQGHWD